MKKSEFVKIIREVIVEQANKSQIIDTLKKVQFFLKKYNFKIYPIRTGEEIVYADNVNDFDDYKNEFCFVAERTFFSTVFLKRNRKLTVRISAYYNTKHHKILGVANFHDDSTKFGWGNDQGYEFETIDDLKKILENNILPSYQKGRE